MQLARILGREAHMQLSAPDAHKDRRFLLHGHTG